MKTYDKKKLVQEHIRKYGCAYWDTKVLSVGSGEWVIEVYDKEGHYMFEMIGGHDDDLWSGLRAICQS